MNYQPLLWAAAFVTLTALPVHAQANNGHPYAYSFKCAEDPNEFFSEFVNINGGLYWTGGGTRAEDGETGLVVYGHGFAAKTLTMQYQIGGSTADRNLGVFIVFTDKSSSVADLAQGAHLEKGFSISSTAHGLYNLTWNAAAAGDSGKSIAEIIFVDSVSNSEETFEDYVTRVYINGVLAQPSGNSSFCF